MVDGIRQCPGQRRLARLTDFKDFESPATYSKRPRAPRTAAMDLGQVGMQRKRGLVSQRNIDDAVMSQCAQRADDRGFLPSSLARGGNEDSSVLSPVGPRLPLLAGAVPECFPLGGEVAVPSWDAQQESVVALEDFGRDERNVGGLTWSIHLGKDLLREGFLHSVAADH